MFKTFIFPDLDAIKSTAFDSACADLERWDVPRGSDVPLHLRDTQPRFYKTRDGHRVTSRVLIQETLTGSASIVQEGINMLSASILALLAVLSLVSPTLALVFLVPVIGLYIVTASAGAGRFIVMLLLSLGAGHYFASLTSFPLIPTAYIGLAVLYCLSPIVTDLLYGADRERQALEQGMQFSGASGIDKGMMYEMHIEARKAQYAAAKKDTSPVLQYGVARGVFARTSQDGFASDAGLPFAMSLNDFKENFLWAYGVPGSGKTAGVLRPTLHYWMHHKAGGALILDGKSNLPKELANVPGVTVLRPGTTAFGLIEGLQAEEVTTVFASHSGAAKADFFSMSAANFLLRSCVVLESCCTLGAPAYRWSVDCIFKMVSDSRFRTDAIQALRDSGQFDAEIFGTSFLRTAIDFFDQWASMPADTGGGIIATVQSWLNPVLSNRTLYAWASSETGFDLTAVLRGDIVAIDTSVSEFGPAGLLVQKMAKERVYRALKLRNDQWFEEPAQRHVLCLYDEAQELLDEISDGSMLAVGRSLGTCFCMATQSYDALVARFIRVGSSREAASALRACFRATICLQASPMTINDDIRPLLGSNMRRIPIAKAEGIAYDQLAKSVIESGSLRPRSRLLGFVTRFKTPGALAGTAWGWVKPVSPEPGDKQTDGFVPQGEGEKKDDPHLRLATGYTMQTKPVLDLGEEMVTCEKFVAIAQFKVAGCIRRDVIKLMPQFGFDTAADTAI